MDILYLSHHVYFYGNKAEYLKAYSFGRLAANISPTYNWKGQGLLGFCQGGHAPFWNHLLQTSTFHATLKFRRL